MLDKGMKKWHFGHDEIQYYRLQEITKKSSY